MKTLFPYLFDNERHPFTSGCFAALFPIGVFVGLLEYLPTIP